MAASEGFVHPEFLIETDALNAASATPVCASSTARPI